MHFWISGGQRTGLSKGFNMKWTDEETVVLKKMCDAGVIIDEILTVFPYRTREQIRHKANYMGLKLTYHAEPEIDMEAFNKLMKGK